MDAFEILGQMHMEAKDAFQKINAAPPPDRESLWKKLSPELALHEQMEERFVYEPMSHDIGSRDPMLRDWDQKHHTEVGAAEELIHRIDRLSPSDASWFETVEKLHGALEEHIRTEESDIWPRIRSFWDESKLRTAGTEIQAAKSAGSIVSTVKGATGKDQRGEHAA